MTHHPKRVVAIAAATLSLALVTAAWAQKPVTQGAEVSETFTIEAIDYNTRLVTLKDSAGITEIVAAGPEIKRFDELKVGDKVTFRYYESVVLAIRQPGQPAPAAESAGVTRSTGPRPGGTLAKQQTKSVVIKAIDPVVPSVTITTDDKRTMSFRVEDKKNIEGLKVGDRVDITYTQAIAVGVESPK